MQRYIKWCRELPFEVDDDGPYRIWHEPPLLGEVGYCEHDEICMDPLRWRTDRPSVARCVNKDEFNVISRDGGDIHGEHRIKMANMVLSRYDGATPLSTNSMEAAYAESGPVNPAALDDFDDTNSSCRDCFELRTKSSAPQTENLKIQTSLMTAGVIGGVLWVGVALSG